MSANNRLYILWTNDNVITAENMVFMYATNALVHGWWEEVTLIIWGATAKLVCENTAIQGKIREPWTPACTSPPARRVHRPWA